MLGKLSRATSFLFLIVNLRFQQGARQVVDFIFSSPLIRPLQVRSELNRFAQIVASIRPKKVLEIGTFQGGTLCMFARLSAPCATIISIDLPGGNFGGGQTRLRSLLYHMFGKLFQRMYLIRGDSHSEEISEKVREMARSLDMLFIDGDHSYDGVKHDFVSYSPLVRPGGIIAFHDIGEQTPETGCEVFRFWNEVKTSYRYEEIFQDQDRAWGIGVLYL